MSCLKNGVCLTEMIHSHITQDLYNEYPNDISKVVEVFKLLRGNGNLVCCSDTKLLQEIIYNLYRYNDKKNGVALDNMKLLLVIGMENIALQTLFIDNDVIIQDLLFQSGEKKRMDMVNKVIGKIMTKLPRDIREKISPNTKARMVRILSSDKSMNNLINYKKVRNQLNRERNETRLKNVNMLDYKNSIIDVDTTRTNKMLDINNDNIILASYIDENPELHIDEYNQVYYHDKYSNALTPVKLSNMKQVSKEDVENILKHHEISKDELKQTLEILYNNNDNNDNNNNDNNNNDNNNNNNDNNNSKKKNIKELEETLSDFFTKLLIIFGVIIGLFLFLMIILFIVKVKK